MPTSTDLVTDLPADFEVFGQAVDTQMKTNADAAIAKSIVTTKGDLIVATGSATVVRQAVGTNGHVLTADSTQAGGVIWSALPSSSLTSATATVTTSQTISSSTYADLATAGPAVTVTTGTKALVIVSARCVRADNNANSYMSFAVSGATTTAASDVNALNWRSSNTSDAMRASAASSVTLTAGSNTFTAKYRAENANPAAFSDRQIFVLNLG